MVLPGYSLPKYSSVAFHPESGHSDKGARMSMLGRGRSVRLAVAGISLASLMGLAFTASAAAEGRGSSISKMDVMRPRSSGATSTGGNLFYKGGTAGVGVETAPKVYLVLWGSQWNNNDPSCEATMVQNFLSGVGGSAWLNSITQYCRGVSVGTYFCNGAGTPAGNPSSGIFGGVWADNGGKAPPKPHQSQIAGEAVRAAAHFANTAPGSNASTQYVIATATRSSSAGFGTSWCAYHDWTSSSYGSIAYTNLPYVTDAGAG